MTAEELLALTDEQRREMDRFAYIAEISFCSRCSDCWRCSDCSDCYGIVDGRRLRFVYKGIQLTEEQYRSIVK